MNRGERVSAVAASLGKTLQPVIAFTRPDIGRQILDRRWAVQEIESWSVHRNSDRLVWLHGSSAGELLGATPTIDELRKLESLNLVVTHFSPSGATALDHLQPENAGYPPLDRPSDCNRAMKLLRPDLLVFAKLDVWPGLIGAAARFGTPCALINGVVRADSSRLRPLSRWLFRQTYGALDMVGAADERDAARLVSLGVRTDVLYVTGDAAFDLAASRADRASEPGGWKYRFEAALPKRPKGGIRLIAGSTREEDERALLDVLDDVVFRSPGSSWCQLVIAPHKPSEAHVGRLLADCRARGKPCDRLSRLNNPKALAANGVIVFDEVGRLAELYTAGDVAYVGGGLKGKGLHNVLEPASAGIPVLFGDEHDRGDAKALVKAGGGITFPPHAFGEGLIRIKDVQDRNLVGARARQFIEDGSGAGRRTAASLAQLWSG
jgi:3-deoxy-D-manno-octulosonic-acid transferase